MIRLSTLHVCRHLSPCQTRSLTSIPSCLGAVQCQSPSWDRNSSSPLIALNLPSTSSVSHTFLNAANKQRLWHSCQPIRTFLSQVSHTGFNDYDIGRKEFKLQVPEHFNFANVLDEWARKERVSFVCVCSTFYLNQTILYQVSKSKKVPDL